MQITWEILGRQEIERIDREARRILETTGLEVFDGALRTLMQKGGAKMEGERVRFPSELVDEALGAEPRTFSLYEVEGQA